MKPGNAPQHIVKALELLRAARVLIEAGMDARSARQAYYAVFHLAEALLATAGHGAATDAGVHTLLARHFVKDGPLPSDTSQRFTHLMGDRLNADYGVDRQLDEAGGRRSVALAASLSRDLSEALAQRVADPSLQALRDEIEALAAAAC